MFNKILCYYLQIALWHINSSMFPPRCGTCYGFLGRVKQLSRPNFNSEEKHNLPMPNTRADPVLDIRSKIFYNQNH